MSITTGILTGGANAHQTTSEEANAWATDFISEGIVGSVGSTNGIAPTTGSWSINAQGTPDMTVAVGSGTAYVTGTPSSQASQTFRVKNSASSNVTISANSSGSTKYDWVYIQLDATKLNTPNTAGDDVATLVTSRSSSASSDDGTPPTYGYPLAVVTVANGAVSITNSNIRDLRTQSTISSTTAGTSNDWYSLALSPNTVTALGNRSYSLVFNSTDLTSYISNGMRLKLPRTVTPPTQCADLESGSSQSFTATNATGLATGTTWTWKAKIKPESYTLGVIAAIDDGTNRMEIRQLATGQIEIAGGTTAAEDLVTSYQSVSLGKWQDITASITIGTPTGEIRIDDVVVPSSVTASASTTMTISGDEEIYIGRDAAGRYYDGKICQVGLFNAIISDATLKTYSGQTMTGSETSCEGFWSLNGVLTDASANANTLTAGGGALTTTVDSPMNATEYAIVMANSFSTNTTLTVSVPEGYSLPTTGGIGTVSYSTQDVPYGFPKTSSKWNIEYVYNVNVLATGTNDTWAYITGAPNISAPVGAFEVGYDAFNRIGNPASTGSFHYGFFALSTTASSTGILTDTIRSQGKDFLSGGAPATSLTQLQAYTSQTNTTATTYYLIYKPYSDGTLQSGSNGLAAILNSWSKIYAKNLYL